MKTIVAAFHPELPRDLRQGLLQRKDLRILPVRTLQDLVERMGRGGVDLALIGPQLGEHGAVSIGQTVRGNKKVHGLPMLLIWTGGGSVPPGLHAQFDEMIEWPQKAAVLPQILSRLLGLHVREHDRFPLRVHVFHGALASEKIGAETYLGSSIDLSIEGMLLRATRAISVGERLAIRFTLPGRPQPLSITAKVVRADSQSYAPEHTAGLKFEPMPDEARNALRDFFSTWAGGRNFRWNIIRDEQRQVIYLSGVLNAEVDLTPLKQLRGELDFHMRDFRRISSDSIQSWLDLMRSLTGASKIRLHECPIQFVQQANAISNLLDNTEVVSFYAPYLCSRCGLDEERLVDVQKDLHDAQGTLQRRPPPFRCVRCGAEMAFDDIPERYFMFL